MPAIVTAHAWRAIWQQVAETGSTGLVETAFDLWVPNHGWRPIGADTDARTLFAFGAGGALITIEAMPQPARARQAAPQRQPRKRGLLRGKRC